MSSQAFSDWTQVGRRIGFVRSGLGVSREQLAERMNLPLESIVEIEAGERPLSTSELARVALALGQTPGSLTSEPPPQIVSLRSQRAGAETRRIDIEIEGLARDFDLLFELEVLDRSVDRPRFSQPEVIDEAASLAKGLRAQYGPSVGPLVALDVWAERVGLHSFSIELGDNEPDGAYLSLGDRGIALINGSRPSGRRRFTLAHEIGHHLFDDPYATDWAVLEGPPTEQLMSALAVHLLLPRESIEARWNELQSGSATPRLAAITIGAEYQVSWSVVCAQLSRFGILEGSAHADLLAYPPTRADYVENGLRFDRELESPSVPPKFAASVLSAFRRRKIGDTRAVEILRESIAFEDLPSQSKVPLEAYASELDQ